jgi:uncharacterized membrane protein YphA (DoxX/SURF4 family)
MANTSQPRTASFYIKRSIGIILILCLSAIFIYSGISKLFSLEAFEWTFMDMGIRNMLLASIIAHVFIGIEFMIGLFLLLHIYLKSFTYPVTLIMLVLLTAYLAVLIVQQGNTGSCGCFGDWIYMKPLDAIWKNLAMMAATIILMVIHPIKPYKNQEWISAIAGMAALVVPLVVSPLNVDNKPTTANEPINLNYLYKNTPPPSMELRTGKHIVAFMSLTCPHCRKAAYLMHILKRQHKDFSFFIVLTGHPDLQDEFFKETQATNLPFILMKDVDAFSVMAGNAVPAIYWINNSVIERKSNYMQMDPKDIEAWMF